MKASLNQPDALERSPAMILKRLAVLGFAAIATTALTITATLFDLASSALAKNYFWGLQNEVESVLAQNNGVWSKQGLNKMIRVDSALKESLRMAGVSSRGVMKKVVNAEGVDLPGGIHLPCGVGVGVSSYTVHHDESVYSRPNTYDAFRFLQGTETMPLDSYSHKQANQPSVGPTAISASLARTSKTFMAFSHGRHAWLVNKICILRTRLIFVSQSRTLPCSESAQTYTRLYRFKLRNRTSSRANSRFVVRSRCYSTSYCDAAS